MSSLGRRLRVYRAETNITLREAEERTGISKSTLSKIENESAPVPDLKTYTGIANLLNLPLWQVMEMDGQDIGLSQHTTAQLQRLASLASQRAEVQELLELLAGAEERDQIAMLNYLRVARSKGQ